MDIHPLTIGKSTTWETGTQGAQGHHNIKHDVSAILMLKDNNNNYNHNKKQ